MTAIRTGGFFRCRKICDLELKSKKLEIAKCDFKFEVQKLHLKLRSLDKMGFLSVI